MEGWEGGWMGVNSAKVGARWRHQGGWLTSLPLVATRPDVSASEGRAKAGGGGALLSMEHRDHARMQDEGVRISVRCFKVSATDVLIKIGIRRSINIQKICWSVAKGYHIKTISITKELCGHLRVFHHNRPTSWVTTHPLPPFTASPASLALSTDLLVACQRSTFTCLGLPFINTCSTILSVGRLPLDTFHTNSYTPKNPHTVKKPPSNTRIRTPFAPNPLGRDGL